MFLIKFYLPNQNIYLLFTENGEKPNPYIVHLHQEPQVIPIRHNVPMAQFPYHTGKIKFDEMQGKLILLVLFPIEKRMKTVGLQD